MHVAAIVGPGNVFKALGTFQREANAQWTSLIEQADVIVVFGGDGTIHRNLSTLVDLDVPVLIVPCGSGNDFARAVGVRTVQDAIFAWQKFSAGASNTQAIDLGVIECPAETSGPAQRYFCCVAGVGLDAAITRRANALPKWIRAHGGYGLSAPREFFRFSPFPMKISPNGSGPGVFKPTMLAAVANAPSFGGGMRIAPHAKMDDGKLDVCIVRAMDKFTLFRLFPTVYFGRHLDSSKVEYVQAPIAKIETEVPFDVFADGEFVCQTPVEFSVASKALQVIVPT
ncbi:MAG TPA: diacylglycerol kinase family protein [Terriglobales bacterium]|nr:diacylglycerol kinase family protein [Terriglobales bacterium]